MGSSKNIHLVSQAFPITHSEDPLVGDYPVPVVFYLRLDQMVSRTLAKSIRQGSNFRVIGFGAALTGSIIGDAGSPVEDLDEGGAALVRFDWVGPTKEKIKAWSRMKRRFLSWRRMAGGTNRFDDFTVCFDPGHHADSDVWAANWPFSVIVDSENMRNFDLSDQHNPGLLGNTIDAGVGLDYTGIFDEYQSRRGYTFDSRDSDGNIISRAKFNRKPSHHTQGIAMTCSLTPATDTPDEGEPYSIAHSMEWLPSDNHASVMCGLVRVTVWLLPVADALNIEDDMSLILTLGIEGWNELK